MFNSSSDDGFVIVSGDDRMSAVLGYSYIDTYNSDEMPDNMRGWMEGYAEQYEYLQAHSDTRAVKQTSISGERIESMLVTR